MVIPRGGFAKCKAIGDCMRYSCREDGAKRPVAVQRNHAACTLTIRYINNVSVCLWPHFEHLREFNNIIISHHVSSTVVRILLFFILIEFKIMKKCCFYYLLFSTSKEVLYSLFSSY